MDEKKHAYLITETDLIQVFCYQTASEWYGTVPWTEVFWKRKDYPIVYGPFPSVHDAMDHVTKTIAVEKNEPVPEVGKNVIYVDFKTKKRL